MQGSSIIMPELYSLVDLQTTLDKKFYPTRQATIIAKILESLQTQKIEIPSALFQRAKTWVDQEHIFQPKDLKLGNQISVLFVNPIRGYYVGYIVRATPARIRVFYPADGTISWHARDKIIFEYISERPTDTDQRIHDHEKKCTYCIPMDPDKPFSLDLIDEGKEESAKEAVESQPVEDHILVADTLAAPSPNAMPKIEEQAHHDDEAQIIFGLKRVAAQYAEAAEQLEQRRSKRTKIGQDLIDIMTELPGLLKICSKWSSDLVHLIHNFKATDRSYSVLTEMFHEYRQMFPDSERTLEAFTQQMRDLHALMLSSTKQLARTLNELEPPASQQLTSTTSSSPAAAQGLFMAYNPRRSDDTLRLTAGEISFVDLDKAIEQFGVPLSNTPGANSLASDSVVPSSVDLDSAASFTLRAT